MISKKVISYHKMLKSEYIHNNFMHLKTMIYSDLSNTVILTFFWRRSNACNTCDAVPTAGQSATLLQGLIVGSLFSSLSTRTLRSIFFLPTGGPVRCAGAWGFSSPDLKVCIFHCWTWNFRWPISPACQEFFSWAALSSGLSATLGLASSAVLIL